MKNDRRTKWLFNEKTKKRLFYDTFYSGHSERPNKNVRVRVRELELELETRKKSSSNVWLHIIQKLISGLEFHVMDPLN